MIETLLVDDNKFTIHQFKNSINWNKVGFEIVSVAYNGNDALNEFTKFYPKVVITDIQMPGLSGIDLAKKIKEISPDTIILFMSNYDEFAYVRSALHLGAFDYILKSESNSKIIYEKLDKVRRFTCENKNKSTLFKEGSFSSLLSELSLKDVDKDLIKEFYKIFPHKYSLYLISQKHILPVISKLTGEYTEAFEEAIVKRTLYDFDENIAAIIKLEDYQYLLLSKADHDRYIQPIDLKQCLYSQLSSDFTILPICREENIEECVKKLISNKIKINDMYFYPSGVILNEEIPAEEEIIVDYDELKKLQITYQFESICEYIDKYYPVLHRQKNYREFTNLTKFLFEELLLFNNQIFDFEKGLIFSVIDHYSKQYWNDCYSIAQWLKEKYLLLHSFVQNSCYLDYSKSIQYAMNYVHKNYKNQNLSNEMIADHVNLSVNHLNKLMKKEMGITIGKYLTKIRMDKARELMEDGFTITKIYPKVGYISLTAFSRAFKNTFGISPQEYKRQLI